MTGHPKPAPREPKPPKRIARGSAPKRGKMRATRKHLKPEWRKLRKLVMDRDKGWCRICDQQPAVDVHHLQYAQGRGVKGLLVEPEHLIAVCRRCHMGEHHDRP